MTASHKKLAVLAAFAALCAGCASPRAIKCYTGPLRSVDEVSVVRGHGMVCLVGVDDIQWDGFGKTVEVPPGLHSFIFELRNARGVESNRGTVKMVTKPGHVYQTSSEMAKTGRPALGQYTVRIHLVDITETARLDPDKRVVKSK